MRTRVRAPPMRGAQTNAEPPAITARLSNPRQIGLLPKRLKQAKTVAAGCDQLPFGFHGKEGVDGSSPSEGSAKAPHVGPFSFRRTCSTSIVRWVWSRLSSFRVGGPVLGRPTARERAMDVRQI